MPGKLYNFIGNDENFKTLNKLKLKFNETIIKIFLKITHNLTPWKNIW